jgi:hypothetical protein
VLTPGNCRTYDRDGRPRYSCGNAAAPSRVDMIRRLVRAPRCANAMPDSAVRCGTLPRYWSRNRRVARKEGSRGPRLRARGRSKTPPWMGFVLTI